MICYRSVPQTFGTKEHIFQGIGAAIGGGRWNPKGLRAIYCSQSIAVTASERAYLSLSRNIEAYNLKHDEGGAFPGSYLQDITKQSFKMAKIELKISSDLIDLTREENLNLHLAKANLKPATLIQARADTYLFAPPSPGWTRQLGDHLFLSGAKGIIVPSARSNRANNVVLFEQNLDESTFEIKEIVDIRLSALSSSDGKIVRRGHRASTSEVEFNSPLETGKTEILYL
jgi:RES domain-containing protein